MSQGRTITMEIRAMYLYGFCAKSHNDANSGDDALSAVIEKGYGIDETNLSPNFEAVFQPKENWTAV